MILRTDPFPPTQSLYFQDGLGSTSHFSNGAGILKEAYRYGTFGQTTILTDAGLPVSGIGEDVRHLYTGQLWMAAAGLYDYRNRAYSPTLTRFLQPDPIGFAGDPTNLYRNCGNNPVNNVDPFGLRKQTQKKDGGGTGGGDSSSDYYGNDPLSPGSDYTGIEFPYEPSTGEGGTDRVSIGGPPPLEPGRNWAPGDVRPNDPGSGPSDGGGGGRPGGVPSGKGNETGPARARNPYLDSGPFIAELANGFEPYHLPETAVVFEEGAQYVPDFIPGFGTVGRGMRGLITPAKYFRGKTTEGVIAALIKKFGPPRSVRPGAQTFYNPRTGRSFNVHYDPAHGSPHVDIRRRGGYDEHKYFLDE